MSSAAALEHGSGSIDAYKLQQLMAVMQPGQQLGAHNAVSLADQLREAAAACDFAFAGTAAAAAGNNGHLPHDDADRMRQAQPAPAARDAAPATAALAADAAALRKRPGGQDAAAAADAANAQQVRQSRPRHNESMNAANGTARPDQVAGEGRKHKRRRKAHGEPFDFSKYATRYVALRLMYIGWPYHGFPQQVRRVCACTIRLHDAQQLQNVQPAAVALFLFLLPSSMP